MNEFYELIIPTDKIKEARENEQKNGIDKKLIIETLSKIEEHILTSDKNNLFATFMVTKEKEERANITAKFICSLLESNGYTVMLRVTPHTMFSKMFTFFISWEE